MNWIYFCVIFFITFWYKIFNSIFKIEGDLLYLFIFRYLLFTFNNREKLKTNKKLRDAENIYKTPIFDKINRIHLLEIITECL